MSFEIISGPTLDELLDSFRHAYDGDACEPVEFEVEFSRDRDNEPLLVPMADVRILGIQHNDGSGTSFKLYGRCMVNLRCTTGKPDENHGFRAYYSTKEHSGWISFPSF